MNNQFNFSYSAPTAEERKEIESIRKHYIPQEKKKETKLEKLRRMNAQVKNTAIITSVFLGIFGCLIFGLGLAMILEWNLILWGVIICATGTVPTAIAYPIYQFVLKKRKQKYADEILQLSEELLNENTNSSK
ncbi:MAG: hypothetical protein IKD43_04555 [Clostridia bacterium]|nr:hypothetical protein [Clostridia bacterium]